MTIEIVATINSDGAKRGAAELNRALDSSQRHVERFDRGILNVNRALSAFAGFLTIRALTNVGRAAISAADDFTRLEARLTALGTGGFTALEVMEAIGDAADRARVPVNDLTDVYARNSVALERLGYSQAEAVRVAETLSKLGTLSGASAESVSKALFQISQGLNAGALRGEEFNSMAEQTPEIMRAMADALGMTTGELRKAAMEGRITGQTIADAMLYASETTDAKFDGMAMTVDQSLTLLSNSFAREWGRISKEMGVTETWSDLVRDFTAALEGPVGRDVLKMFANGLNLVASGARAVGDAIKWARDQLNADLTEWQATLARRGVVSPVDGFAAFAGAGAGLANSDARIGGVVPLTGRSTNPLRGRPTLGAGTADDSEAKRIQRTIDRTRELVAAEELRNAVVQARLNGEFEVARQLENQLQIEQRITPEMEKHAPLLAAELRQRLENGAELERQLENQSELIARNQAFADELASTLTTGFANAIKQGESFTDVLRNVAAQLFEVVAQAAILDPLQRTLSASISGAMGSFDLGGAAASLAGGFAFAKGGVLNSPAKFTSGGMRAVAGEAGPEAILPLRRGADGSLGVVSNGGGSNVTNVNITVEGDATDATVEKMRRVAESVFGARSATLINASVSAVAQRNRADRNYLRR